MAKIYSLGIKNFRGIQNFAQVFDGTSFVCLIGRGDSGKSTILDAISYALSPSWNIPFHDTDFYQCDVDKDIEIEVTVTDLPEKLLNIDDKYGLLIRGIRNDRKLTDTVMEDQEKALTIRLRVSKDLEPEWVVTNGRDEKQISANDRGWLDAFMLSDYSDRHFTWTKGGPLFSLLRKLSQDEDEADNTISMALREAKVEIDKASFPKFEAASKAVKTKAGEYGVDISDIRTTIDFRDIPIRDGKVSLHADKIPFRMKGKGSRRLISAAIQAALAENGGIILIDEFEQGLEPDRVQHLASNLKASTKGQVFITTHSRDVVVQLSSADLFLMRRGEVSLKTFDADMQACVRANPEAFFSKKILLCEGPTEIGVCQALNEYRMRQGKPNCAFLGVQFANGSGSNSVAYCRGFLNAGFDVALFCDSDVEKFNKEKAGLTAMGAHVFDWTGDHFLEQAIITNVPFALLEKIMDLAADLQAEAHGDKANAQSSMWDGVKAKYGTGHPQTFAEANDDGALRLAISKAAKSQEWFKRRDKAAMLGGLIFDNYAEVRDNELKQRLEGLSNWMSHV